MRRVCFLGTTRYSKPLDATQRKKWRALRQTGEMHVIGFATKARGARFVEEARFYLLPALPLAAARYVTVAMLGAVLATWLVLARGVSIVVAQSPFEAVPAVLARGVARLCRRRLALIVESHGDFEESLFLQRRVPAPRLVRAVMHRIARFTLARADVLRAVSSSTERQLAAWNPRPPRIRFATWTDIELFLSAADGSGPERSELVYAGVLIPRKGVDVLLEAFGDVARRFPTVTLSIVGRPDNVPYVEDLHRRVQGAGLEDRVTFAGEMPQDRLAQVLARATAFVLPTLSEGLPRVVLEAMAAACPVVATAVSGTPDVIEDGRTGLLVPPGDAPALADRLIWVLSHPAEAQTMGQRARAFVAARYSTAAYVRHYAELFERAEGCIARGRRAGR